MADESWITTILSVAAGRHPGRPGVGRLDEGRLRPRLPAHRDRRGWAEGIGDPRLPGPHAPRRRRPEQHDGRRHRGRRRARAPGSRCLSPRGRRTGRPPSPCRSPSSTRRSRAFCGRWPGRRRFSCSPAVAALFTARQVERPCGRSRTWSRRPRARSPLSEQLLALQEEERQRIARELHDSTTAQHLGDQPGADAAGRRDPAEPGRPEDVREIGDLLDRALLELRVFTYLLHPPSLADEGLGATLRAFIEGFAGGRDCRRASGWRTPSTTLRRRSSVDPAGGAGGARQRPSARRGIRVMSAQSSSGIVWSSDPRRWPGHDGGRRRRRSSPNGRRHPGHARAPAAVRRRPEDQDRRDVAAGHALAGAFERCRASVAAADRAKVCQGPRLTRLEGQFRVCPSQFQGFAPVRTSDVCAMMPWPGCSDGRCPTLSDELERSTP